MKKTGILNSKIVALIGRMGHGNRILICDAGFPHADYPDSELIDLAVIANLPAFHDVFDAIFDELVVEKVIVPAGMCEVNRSLYELLCSYFKKEGDPDPYSPEEIFIMENDLFKGVEMKSVKTIIRTGECTPFGNAILVCGTSY